MENWQRAGFGLYVHWPFCAAKCPYCDFNSHVTSSVDQARWRAALLHDLEYWADRTPDRVLTSIFFGGGTPSLMDPDTVAAIIDFAKRRWTPANNIEITLEANPTSVEAARFSSFIQGGVNRFSVGLQALNDPDLKRLGRLHSTAEGRRAFDVARSLTDRVSFDLIYARQDQTAQAWEAELTQALGFAAGHLSLYQLTIEDGTAFGARHAAGRLAGLPEEDLSVDLWEITQSLCENAGLRRYETSNHATIGMESLHNAIYWQGGDWVGIGPGAHGRLSLPSGRVATEAAKLPAAWLDRVEKTGTGTTVQVSLSPSELVDEYLIMGLRLRDGLDIDHLDRLGATLQPEGLRSMIDDGLLEKTETHLKTTDRGALLLNSILAQIAPVSP